MEFAKLLEPYVKVNPTSGLPDRTVEGQVKWLLRKGIPRDIVDKAMLTVYHELEQGRKFEDTKDFPAGHILDRYLLQTALDMQKQSMEIQTKQLEEFLSKFKEDAVIEYIKAQKGSIWKRVKAVFKP